MRFIFVVLALALLSGGSEAAKPDFCAKDANHPQCEVSPLPEPDPSGGYPCPEGYVFVEFYNMCLPRFADRPADFCDKHPDHKSCKPLDIGTTGCPPGTIYVDTWGCVPWG